MVPVLVLVGVSCSVDSSAVEALTVLAVPPARLVSQVFLVEVALRLRDHQRPVLPLLLEQVRAVVCLLVQTMAQSR